MEVATGSESEFAGDSADSNSESAPPDSAPQADSESASENTFLYSAV